MEALENIWKKVQLELSNKLSAASYMVWINSLKPVCVKDNELIICAQSNVSRKKVEDEFLDSIKFILNSLGYNFNNVLVITEEEKEYFIDKEDVSSLLSSMVTPKKVHSSPFVARYTFENFVVGECNKMAFESAKFIASSPGANNGPSLNPFFIYSGVGLGKTHLLHAIGNEINKNLPELNVIYISTETLTNEYFNSLNKYSTDRDSYRNFREKYASADVLMVDDVQFLQKKGGLQEVFFHIFNDLYQAGKQIILSSDRPPKDINDIEDRLRSRFEWGLSTDMTTPGFDTRIAIIMKKMEKSPVKLTDDIIYYIAEKINTNIRELEGALNKIVMYAQLANKTPSLELAKEALKVDEIENGSSLDSNKIISAVCQYFRVESNEVISKKKNKEIVEARMIAVYLIRELLALPLITIGQLFGGRDHSTISYSIDKITSSLSNNKRLETQIKDIKSILNAK